MDLSSAGYRIIVASNGQEALDKMETQDGLDLLLVDALLPDMDGIQLTRMVRNTSIYRFLPIVVMSSNRTKSSDAEGLIVGVTGWLNLSVTPEQLQNIIYRLLS